MAKISRHDLLSELGEEVAAGEGLCPVCGEPVVARGEGEPLACDRCCFPRDGAAFVEYDGCC